MSHYLSDIIKKIKKSCTFRKERSTHTVTISFSVTVIRVGNEHSDLRVYANALTNDINSFVPLLLWVNC